MLSHYADILQKICSLAKGHAIRSLSNMQKLCKLFDHPQNSFPVIHVAGTNGKGSVCEKIARALQLQGYKTGLNTSPHLSNFRERIRIDGTMIPEEEVVLLYSQILEKEDLSSSTFFEIATLLAFLHFQKQKIDIAVIETGLGGMWDATNVVLPLLSIITSIGYDHQEILGSSLEEICRAKAGIIKKNTPVVIGPQVPLAWIRQAAPEELHQASHEERDYDLENQSIARLALEKISEKFPLDTDSIEEGLKVTPPCRFERHQREKMVILDVAHNPQGFEKLLEKLQKELPHHSFRFVCGFSKGKEIKECARLIEERSVAVHLVSGTHARLASVEELRKVFHANKMIFLEDSIADGIQHALRASTESPEAVIIAGSFFIMEEARCALRIK